MYSDSIIHCLGGLAVVRPHAEYWQGSKVVGIQVFFLKWDPDTGILILIKVTKTAINTGCRVQ